MARASAAGAALGHLGLLGLDLAGGRIDGARAVLILFGLLTLGLAAGHALSLSPAAAWGLQIAVGVQALGLLGLLAFLLMFKMNRLW